PGPAMGAEPRRVLLDAGPCVLRRPSDQPGRCPPEPVRGRLFLPHSPGSLLRHPVTPGLAVLAMARLTARTRPAPPLTPSRAAARPGPGVSQTPGRRTAPTRPGSRIVYKTHSRPRPTPLPPPEPPPRGCRR